MEGITRLVDDSLARHGVDVSVRQRSLEWSPWLRCDSSLSFLQVPSAGGIYTLGEEVIAPGQTSSLEGRRLLAVFRIAEAEDLCVALSRHLAPRSALSDRLSSARCFVRFAEVGDAAYRRAACQALQQWMASSSEAATGVVKDFVLESDPPPTPEPVPSSSWSSATDSSPPSLPDGF